MPMDRKLYPKNWQEIREKILRRARDRCECAGECGLHHGRRCTETNYADAQYAKGRIILTVAHLDHMVRNNELGNLKAMCQRCHLRLDRVQHKHNARIGRDEKVGQRHLFGRMGH